MIKKNRTFDEQIELFIERGLIVKNKETASKKIENISYYKLKEYTKPFIIGYKREDNNSPIYGGLTFEDLLERYYQDKNLRIHLFHVIEKIEISFKTRLAYNLGNLDEYGYLDINKWIHRNKNNKNLNYENKDKFKNIFEKHLKYDGYGIKPDLANGNYSIKAPSIWNFINSLTFGECAIIYKIMSTNRKEEIANYYGVNTGELRSWIESLKLVRNICAHNGSIIDFKFKTKPKIRNDWEKVLCNDNSCSDVALIICIVKLFVDVINSNYKFGILRSNLLSYVDESNKKANLLGFKNEESIITILGEKKNNKRKRKLKK